MPAIPPKWVDGQNFIKDPATPGQKMLVINTIPSITKKVIEFSPKHRLPIRVNGISARTAGMMYECFPWFRTIVDTICKR